MPVNTGLIYQGTPQQQQQQNPIQQLAALMQIMQAQKQGQLTDMEIQQKQQAMPLQLAQLQAAADKAKRVNDFYSPQNLQQFSKPEYAAVAAPPAELGGGPGREAGPMVFDENKFLNAGAMQGVIDPLELADKRAKQAQAKATLAATQQQREDALQARLYAIDQRSQDTQLNREQQANLALERNRLTEMMMQMRQDTAAAGGRMQTINIVDPTDPKRMITVNANTFNEEKYKAGDRTGFLGVAGAEPKAAMREEKTTNAKTALQEELDNLRTQFTILDDAKAIPNSDRSGLSNAVASVQSSTAGQMAGRVLGTKEQDARNTIQSARLRLLNAIKGATGMSAQQLNSNVELKTWLDSLTNVSNSVQSNNAILDAIEERFVRGGGMSPSAPTAPTNPSAAPVFTLRQIDDAARRTGKSRDEIIRDIRAKGGRLQ